MITENEKKLIKRMKEGYELVKSSFILGYANIERSFIVFDKKIGTDYTFRSYKNFKQFLKNQYKFDISEVSL